MHCVEKQFLKAEASVKNIISVNLWFQSNWLERYDKRKNALCCWKTILCVCVLAYEQRAKTYWQQEHQQYFLFQFGYTFNLREEHSRVYGCYQPENGKRKSKIEH